MENLIVLLVVIVLFLLFGGVAYLVSFSKVLALVALIGGVGFLFIVICNIIGD